MDLVPDTDSVFARLLFDDPFSMSCVYCQKAEIEDGMAILDLGCGWGSASLFLAAKYC